jgi:hypothetical protein
MEVMLKAPRIMTKAPRIMAKAPHIMLEPLRIIAKAPRNNARTTAYRQNTVWSLTPAMAFHKRKQKMKDDHTACLPYACLLGKNSLPARKQCIVVGRNTPKRSRFHLHYTRSYYRKESAASPPRDQRQGSIRNLLNKGCLYGWRIPLKPLCQDEI